MKKAIVNLPNESVPGSMASPQRPQRGPLSRVRQSLFTLFLSDFCRRWDSGRLRWAKHRTSRSPRSPCTSSPSLRHILSPVARGCSPHFLYRYHLLPTLLYCTSNSTNFSRHSSHRTHLCNPRITPFLPFRYSNLHHLRPKAQPLCNIDIYPLLRRHSSFRALICPSVHPCRTIRPAPIYLSPLRLSPFP